METAARGLVPLYGLPWWRSKLYIYAAGPGRKEPDEISCSIDRMRHGH